MKNEDSDRSRRFDRDARRRSAGFTLIELLVAGIIVTLVIGAVALSLAQVGRARASARVRLEAHLRADAALDAVRRDIQSVVRSDDLYWCRFRLSDDSTRTPAGQMDRDELLLFNSRLESARPTEYNGEGGEYETQLRLESDELGTALWRRRDPVPDRWDAAGGVATPIVEGVVGFLVQAYDGDTWYDEWDSDEQGLPWGVRISVTASGAPTGVDPFSEEYPLVTLRTVVPIDRVIKPYEPPAADAQDLDGDGTISDDELAAAEESLAGAGGTAPPAPGTPVATGGRGGGGAGVPAGGAPSAGGAGPPRGGGAAAGSGGGAGGSGGGGGGFGGNAPASGGRGAASGRGGGAFGSK